MEKKDTIGRKQLKITSLLEDLKSDDVKIVKTAIEGLEIIGEPTIIETVIKELEPSTPSEKNTVILEFLFCIKNPMAKKSIMDIITAPENIDRRQLILSSIWNSTLDYSEYLDTFVKIAIEGSFMETLECLTIIENMEGPFSEKNVMESHVLLSECKTNDFDKQKMQFLSEIALKIKDFQQTVDSDNDLD